MSLKSQIVPPLKVALIACGAPSTRGDQKEKGQVSKGERDGCHCFPSLDQSAVQSVGQAIFFVPILSCPALEGWTPVK